MNKQKLEFKFTIETDDDVRVLYKGEPQSRDFRVRILADTLEEFDQKARQVVDDIAIDNINGIQYVEEVVGYLQEFKNAFVTQKAFLEATFSEEELARFNKQKPAHSDYQYEQNVYDTFDGVTMKGEKMPDPKEEYHKQFRMEDIVLCEKVLKALEDLQTKDAFYLGGNRVVSCEQVFRG